MLCLLKILNVVAVLQVTWVTYGEAGRILVLFPPPTPSHYIIGKALVTGLLEKGHQVTFVTSYGINKQIKGLEEIVLTEFNPDAVVMQKKLMEMNDKSPIEQFTNMLNVTYSMADRILNNTKINKLITTQKFDLIIMDAILNEAHIGIAHHLDCPIIPVSTMGSNIWVNSFVGNPAPPSYVPDVFGGFTTHMTFMDRLKNTIFTYLMQMVYYGYHLPRQDKLLHQYFPDAPTLKEIIAKRVALVILNSHPSISPAKPSVPNMVEIGGFHVSDPQPLPKDLKDYLDNAKEGFILFSMGSNLKSSMLPIETQDALLKVFAQLPYKILWKFEDKQMARKPANVKIEKWLPQNDVLAHSNIKLFITHGGLLSTTEAIHHGVPIVGIPVFGDQTMNMVASEALGIAKTVPLKVLTYEKLLAAVQEVLNNKAYREAAKHRSALLRDRPLRPMDNAVYWIEYVLRHKYSEHLKIGAIHLTWYQEHSLDVLALVGSVLFGIVFILYLGVRKCCKRETKKTVSHRKKKQ